MCVFLRFLLRQLLICGWIYTQRHSLRFTFKCVRLCTEITNIGEITKYYITLRYDCVVVCDAVNALSIRWERTQMFHATDGHAPCVNGFNWNEQWTRLAHSIYLSLSPTLCCRII